MKISDLPFKRAKINQHIPIAKEVGKLQSSSVHYNWPRITGYQSSKENNSLTLIPALGGTGAPIQLGTNYYIRTLLGEGQTSIRMLPGSRSPLGPKREKKELGGLLVTGCILHHKAEGMIPRKKERHDVFNKCCRFRVRTPTPLCALIALEAC